MDFLHPFFVVRIHMLQNYQFQFLYVMVLFLQATDGLITFLFLRDMVRSFCSPVLVRPCWWYPLKSSGIPGRQVASVVIGREIFSCPDVRYLAKLKETLRDIKFAVPVICQWFSVRRPSKTKLAILGIWTRDQNLACNRCVTQWKNKELKYGNRGWRMLSLHPERSKGEEAWREKLEGVIK